MSGRNHFDLYGHKENRRARLTRGLERLRHTKMTRLAPAMRLDMPHEVRGGKYDFLTVELRQKGHIIETDMVSANAYSHDLGQLIARYPHGLVLDCGAGLRDTYYDNVINFEIVDYDTTDVVGLGEKMPFKDNVFDAVISIAVLEHVRDPFACAAEIARVLKPGGILWCSAPFMVPLHGYRIITTI
jgi:SAM-dependent methyltransferase